MSLDLRRRARRYYPQSIRLQRDWLRMTLWLIGKGKHILHGAPASWGNRRQA